MACSRHAATFAGLVIHAMATIEFVLNGGREAVRDPAPTLTLLDWLRESKGLTGTKEGCNEGDCGACTVVLGDGAGSRAVNSCITLLPQIHGKAVRTVEGVAGPGGELHPVQHAMVRHHGSQCGFCTPGFVMSMFASHQRGDERHDDALAGNLCRCTGYAPIIRAAEAAAREPVPSWLSSTGSRVAADALPVRSERMFVPASVDEFADWYVENPGATIVAGATDVGLWITKQLRDLRSVCFVSQLRELQEIKEDPEGVEIGAAVTLDRLQEFFAERHPGFSELIRRFGSVQVRNSATVGGNIANGSPIGDAPPALIALGALLRLRRGDARRSIPLESFFLEYGRQDIGEGEFVESVFVPERPGRLSCHKLSKRFDQDISAVCGCFHIAVEDGSVDSARIAFGGMAGTPKRARSMESALEGSEWSMAAVESAMDAAGKDFEPISDMRASAAYRLEAAKSMMLKCYIERERGDAPLGVLEVQP